MAETVFSLRKLSGRRHETLFGGWRRRVRGALDSRFAVLTAIAPARMPYLDLALLAGPGHDLAESVESFLAGPRQAVRAELDFYADHHGRLPAALAGLADTLAVRRAVLSTMESYHRIAVGPHWRRMRAHLDADRAHRGTILLDNGVDGLLAGLHPDIRWAPPTLHVATEYPCDNDVFLDGRGLRLVPSFFLRAPVVMYDPRDPTDCTLIYPASIGHDQAVDVWTASTTTPALANLLGRTRASVLTAIADGVATTGTLAHRLGISSAAVSQHTAVLRAAGLITTRRHHGSVLHNPTQTGLTLLDPARFGNPARRAGQPLIAAARPGSARRRVSAGAHSYLPTR